ncbi:MAG: hypothetical protein FJW86_12985 [Actinobacteria bacterium]|nr:hypothetical protein [Actinomycetota bacterium]
MNIAIVQARMSSSRLPGKVLRNLGSRPVLSWVLRAALVSEVFDDLVVATSTRGDDDAVASLASIEGARCVRGPLDDVLTRFLMALEGVDVATVARFTADCPLLDPDIIKMAVQAFNPDEMDYLGTTVPPRTLPRGLDVEVFSPEALRRADQLATGPHRSHVTSYLYRHPEDFRVTGLTFSPPADDLRVTLDTEEDAELLDRLVEELGDQPPNWRDIVGLLRSRPDLAELNARVVQKGFDES